MNIIIAKLLRYSFDGVDWDFNRLTETEKAIIGNQAALDEIRTMVDHEFEYCEGEQR